MRRRDFLAMAGAATAGAVVASTLRAQPEDVKKADAAAQPVEKPKRTLRKAVMYGMIDGGVTVADRFRMLRDAGFEGVEMDSPSKISTDEVLKAMEETGIKVHGLVDSVHWKYYLNSPESEIRAKAVDALRTALEDGRKLGAVSILLVPAVVNKDLAYDEAWRLTQEEIRKVLPLAKQNNVRIAIENVWNNFILSPLEAARYVDEFHDPLVGWHFDIGNVINFGFPDQWVRILGKRIMKLHIKDFSRTKRDKEGLWKGFDVQLGEGDAGWPSVMKALDEVGYSTAPHGNWATAEVGGGGPERLKQVSSQMDVLFAM